MQEFRRWTRELLRQDRLNRLRRGVLVEGRPIKSERIQRLVYTDLFRRWHQVAECQDINEFLRRTARWKSPARRGEAFDLWLQIQKMKRTKVPIYTFNREEVLELGIELEKFARNPDRLKIRSRTIWDFKHYKSSTGFSKEVSEQLEDYLKLLEHEDISRVCYLFSTFPSEKNVSAFNKIASKIPEGKSVQIFFIDKDNKIKRFDKIVRAMAH